MQSNGLPDETCQNYEASDTVNECKPLGVCETCVPTKAGEPKNCTQIPHPELWTLGDSGYALGGSDLDIDSNLVTGEQKLQAEIMTNGPLACGIHATPALEAYGVTTPVSHYPGGIFNEHSIPLPNHILSIVGWGTDKEHGEYWLLRNSWGTYWGEGGYGKIKMGLFDNLGVQSSCSYAMPAKMKPSIDPEALLEVKRTALTAGTFFDYRNRQGAVAGVDPAEKVTSPLPTGASAPASFDIRSVGGVNYASPDRNQHIPQYCGSCWAHGPTSALNDRYQLANKNAFPKVFLAPQQLVNCMPPPKDASQGSGGCMGGDPTEVLSPQPHTRGTA